MATFNRTNQFSEDLGKGVHILGTHQLKVALTNTAPTAANATYAALTAPITTGFAGATPFNVTTTSYTQTGGVGNLVLADLTLTANATVGAFRYVVLYNDTPTSPADPLIGWFDYASSIPAMASGETFLIDFAATAITIG